MSGLDRLATVYRRGDFPRCAGDPSAGARPPHTRRAAFGLPAAFVTLVCTGSALAQTASLVDLRGAESVQAIEFLADGEHLAVNAQIRAINIWELLHHYWPEELGALLGVAALTLLVAALRVNARPQRAGEPHCRRCGYCLSGVPDGPCPECGSSARCTGRTARRRVRWPLVAVTVLGTAYAVLFATGVGRWSRAYDWFEWWSVGLVTFAREHDQAWLLSRCESINQRRIIPILPTNESIPVSPDDVVARSIGARTVLSETILGRRLVSAPGYATGSGDAILNLWQDDRAVGMLALPGIPFDDPVRAIAIAPEPRVFAVAIEDAHPGGDRDRRMRIGVFWLPRGTTRLHGSQEPH